MRTSSDARRTKYVRVAGLSSETMTTQERRPRPRLRSTAGSGLLTAAVGFIGALDRPIGMFKSSFGKPDSGSLFSTTTARDLTLEQDERVTFTVTHRSGAMQLESDPSVIDLLLAELDIDDPEHPDVSVTHENGWTLSAFNSGLLVWENVESGPAMHMTNLSRSEVKRLFLTLAIGDVSTVNMEEWLEGYG